MGSSQPQDRSLGEGTFLPQWMKGRLDSRIDFSEGAFSPPSADDSFFYIPYPKRETTSASKTSVGFEVVGSKNEPKVIQSQILKSQAATGDFQVANKNVDFSKHTLPCQAFIGAQNFEKDGISKMIISNKFKPKVQAAGNELQNENSDECGKSIVSVANQMVSSKFAKSTSSDNSASQTNTQDAVNSKIVSKSLPATPLGSPGNTPDSSPKSRRRNYGNRFFTGAFIADKERQQNGWLLSSILGLAHSRELVASKIDEEEEPNTEQLPTRALSRKKSISSQNLSYFGTDEQQENNKSIISQINVLQPKPSELREMNFWSPTSM